MPLVTSPFTVSLAIKAHCVGVSDSKPIVNTLSYYQTAGATMTYGDLPSIFGAIVATGLPALWGALFPNAYVADSLELRWREDSSTAPYVVTGGAWTGTGGSGDFQPPDSAWFLLKRSQGTGKSYRGGLRMSPILEANTLDFRLAAAFLSGPVAAVLPALLSSLSVTASGGPAVMEPFLVSTKNSTLVVSGPCTIVGAEILTFTPRKTMGSNKKRKVKGVY